MTGSVRDGLSNRLGDAEALRLNEAEVYELLAGAGLEVCPHAVLRSDADAAAREAWRERARVLGTGSGRIVLKVLGRNLLHKSDVGGVRILDLEAEDPLDAADALRHRVAVHGSAEEIEGVLAAAFVTHHANTPGAEVLLSVRLDPSFGPVVVIGIGGVLTEWYGKGSGGRSRLLLPAAGLTAAAAAAAVSAHPLLSILLEPSRLYAEPPLTAAVLGETVAALARLALELGPDCDGPTLAELEINPAVVSGGRLVAIDGVGLLNHTIWPAADRPLARIDQLLHPRSAVVLGVSARGANPGRIILGNLRHSAGIPGEALHVVHPQEAVIDGVPCVPTLADLPAKVDLAVVCIPAEGARDAIAEIVALDAAASIILIPGGFAEAGHGELAAEIEGRLAAAHRTPDGGPVMVGGNCLGIVSRDEYNTFFLPSYKLPFSPAEAGRNLALVSQSGAYLVTFASNYDGLINPRASISFGNQMDLTVGDFLAHYLDDAAVDVIACYVEGFKPGDGLRFAEGAREAARRGKQVILFKAGKTALGAQAAASHTASLAGDYDVAKACLEAAGVLMAETLEEFEDLIRVFTLLGSRTVGGARVGILSNAGFECSTAMDCLEGWFDLEPYDAVVRAELDAVLPPFAHRDNPVDATPMAGTEAYLRSTAAILDSPGVDCAIIAAVPVTPALDNLPASADGAHREDLAGADSLGSGFARLLGGSAKPLVLVVDSGELYDPFCRRVAEAGVPVFRKIDRAAHALGRFVASRRR